VGMLNPAFAGLPDYDLWIRFSLKYEIKILNKKIVRYRWVSDINNTSGDTNSNRIRNRFECLKILDNFLKITDLNEFLMIFPEAAKYGKVTASLIPYFLGRIAIDTGWDFRMLWGLQLIYNLIQDEKMSKILIEEYDFSYQDFIKLASKCDVFRISLLSQVPTPPLLHRSAIRNFLSVSKRYAKELYSIAADALNK
jgi:hypothetical protein